MLSEHNQEFDEDPIDHINDDLTHQITEPNLSENILESVALDDEVTVPVASDLEPVSELALETDVVSTSEADVDVLKDLPEPLNGDSVVEEETILDEVEEKSVDVPSAVLDEPIEDLEVEITPKIETEESLEETKPLEEEVPERKDTTTTLDEQTEFTPLDTNGSETPTVADKVDTPVDTKDEVTEDEVPTFLDEIKQEETSAPLNEEVPTFLDEIKQEESKDISIEQKVLNEVKLEEPSTSAYNALTDPVEQDETPAPLDAVPTFLEEIQKDELSIELPNDDVPTFLDEIKNEEAPKDVEADTPSFLDEIKQEEVTENVLEPMEPIINGTPIESAAEPTVEEKVPEEEVPTFLDEIKSAEVSEKPTEVEVDSTAAKPVNEIPTFLDEIKSYEQPVEAKVDTAITNSEDDVPTFLDEIKSTDPSEKPEPEVDTPASKPEVEEVPTFLDEIAQDNVPLHPVSEPAQKEEAPANTDTTPQPEESVLDEFKDDTGSMPWDEPLTTTQEEPKEEPKEDPFAFLEEKALDDDDKASVKSSFSFLDDDFEPLQEDFEPLKELAPVGISSTQSSLSPAPQVNTQQRYAPSSSIPNESRKSSVANSIYSPSRQQATLQPKPKPKPKAFFEELPTVTEMGKTRLTIHAKSNPYAAIVHNKQIHQNNPTVNIAPPPVAMLPPKNPYAPSISSTKSYQESENFMPIMPPPTTAKDSLAQSFANNNNNNNNNTPHFAPRRPSVNLSLPPKMSAPPRSTSRASSNTSKKNFFEELPIMKSPTTSATPKNPYAPLVHNHNHSVPAPYGMIPQSPAINPYGMTHQRKVSSQGNLSPVVNNMPQSQPVNPYMANAPLSPIAYQNQANTQPYSNYAPPQANQPHSAYDGSIGNRSRKSTYLPQIPPMGSVPAQNLAVPGQNMPLPRQFTPALPTTSSSRYAPATAVSPAMTNQGFPPQNPTSAYGAGAYLPQFPKSPQQQYLPHGSMPPRVPEQRNLRSSFSNQAHPPPPTMSNHNAYQGYVQPQKKVDNFQVPPNIEFTMQFPVFRFNRTKKIAKVFAPGSVNIVEAETFSSFSDLDKSFGPLSKSKSKRPVVETWVADKLKFLNANDPSNSQQSLIYTILGELIKGDGVIKDVAPIVQELSRSSSFQFAQGTSINKHTISSLKEVTPKESIVFGLFNYMQEGKREDALQYLMGEKVWPLSFIVAALIGPASVSTVVNEYLTELFGDNKHDTTYVLYFVLNILGGNYKFIIESLKNDQNAFSYFTQNFSLILSLILQNGTNLNPFYVEFGSFLVKCGMTLWGHALFLLSSTPLSELEIEPGVIFSVVGANPLTDRGYYRSIEVMIMSEIYEYALKLSTRLNTPAFGFPHLLRLKVIHASLLADDGCFSSCQRYTDYLPTVIKAAAKTYKVDPRAIAELEDINLRISESEETGWFARPKLFGMIDKGFSKFIAGDDATPAAKTTDGLFTNYSPSISRAQSVADFNSPSMIRPAYGHSNSFIGLENSSNSFQRRLSNAPSSRANSIYNPTGIAVANTNNSTTPHHQQVTNSLNYINGSISRAESSPALHMSVDNQTPSKNMTQHRLEQQASLPPPVYGGAIPRLKSPSVKSEYNDDIADIRSTTSRISNVSRYAPIPKPVGSVITEESSRSDSEPLSATINPYSTLTDGLNSYVGVLDSQNELPQPKAPSIDELPLSIPPVAPVAAVPAPAPALPMSPEVSQSILKSRQSSIVSGPTSALDDYALGAAAHPRASVVNPYAPSEKASPELVRRTLNYNTPSVLGELPQDLSNASFSIPDDSQSDIYGETPSKVNEPSMRRAAPIPVNPYAISTVPRAKKNNRYAPPVSQVQNNVEQSTNASSQYGSDIDIYSFGGYSRPTPPPMNATPEPENSVDVSSPSSPPADTASHLPLPVSIPQVTSPTMSANDGFRRGSIPNSYLSPKLPYSNPPQNFTPRIPNELDDDYNDDVVEDDDSDDEEASKALEVAAAAAAAAAALAEDQKRKDEAKLLEKRKQEEEEKLRKDGGKGGWFGIFGKHNGNKEEKKVYKAKLGEQSHFYYDEKLKRWVNKDSAGSPEEAATPPPPPPTIKAPKKQSDMPLPPPTAPPKSSAAATPGAPAPPSLMPPRSAVSTPTGPPSRKATSGDIDDILNMASTARSTRSKRGPRRGYVDVMNQ